MDETTFRILDTLSGELGNSFSINGLTRRIKEEHAGAYYANIYNKIRTLCKDGIITLTRAGRSSIPSLNFSNYQLPDMLAQIELRKKQELLTKSKVLQILFRDIEERYDDIRSIESISAIDSERNLRLNRTELLILLHDSNPSIKQHDTTMILTTARNIQALHNIKIDPLILTTDEFIGFLTSDETNPLREMLSNKITFHSPQDFWAHISAALAKGYRLRLLEGKTNPARISEKDLTFNLLRFGYKEIGPELEEGQRICIEYITASILMKGDARRIEAIPIILAKNKPNYDLLIFLSQKYRLSGRLLGLLTALERTSQSQKTADAIDILESLGTKEIRAAGSSIAEKMKLYNAVE